MITKDKILERVSKAKLEAQKAYILAQREFSRPKKESWISHYESRSALERDIDFLLKPVPSGVKSPYLVHCIKDEDFGACGESTFLTREQYNQQMTNPNKRWKCPQCGVYPCNFDDENFESTK